MSARPAPASCTVVSHGWLKITGPHLPCHDGYNSTTTFLATRCVAHTHYGSRAQSRAPRSIRHRRADCWRRPCRLALLAARPSARRAMASSVRCSWRSYCALVQYTVLVRTVLGRQCWRGAHGKCLALTVAQRGLASSRSAQAPSREPGACRDLCICMACTAAGAAWRCSHNASGVVWPGMAWSFSIACRGFEAL